MRTVTYKSLRDGAATRLGIDPSTDLQANTKLAIAEYATSAIRSGWEFTDWNDICLLEQRTFPSGENVIAFDQSGQTSIGEVFAAYSNDPTTDIAARKIAYGLSEEGVQFHPDLDYSTIWLKFRKLAPSFSGLDYASATTYAVGDVVYYDTTGECYKCILASTGNLPTNTTYWLKQDVPYFLAEYAKVQIYSDLLAEDGQIDKAQFQMAKAESLLVFASDKATIQQGQFSRFNVTTN